MTLNNAYKIYTVLHERVHQQEENEADRLKPLSMDEAVKELTYSLLQGGGDVRRRAVYHLPAQRDLQYVFDRNGGVKQRTDMDRRFDLIVEQGTIQPPEIESLTMQQH